MRYLSLFSGIGAFEKALTRLGIEYELVGFSEIDKYAIKSYCAIHGVDESLNLGDISKIDLDSLPKDIDLITHGSPCQDFSVAGLQAGGDEGSGTRSSLMWRTVDIVQATKPKYVIWENVKNLLSKKHRHNFDSYLEVMGGLGYKSFYKVLNAKDYGIPQNRERVYTISIRCDLIHDKLVKEYEFPEKQELKLRLKDMLEEKVDEKYYLKNEQIENFIKNKNGKVHQGNISPTITTNKGEGPKIDMLGLLDIKGNDCIKRVYSGEGLSPTLTDMQGGNRQPKVAVAMRGRYNDTGKVEQKIETSNREIANSITTVQKDSLVGEAKLITHTITQIVKVRKYNVNTEKLVEVLRDAKSKVNLTNNEIAEKLNIPVTQVEHYFRKDNCFAIPDPEIWIKLKELLKINTNEFNKSIMTFEEKEGIYEKANRVYDTEGLAPTLTQQKEKISESFMRIRKLTPLECWRLMGFDDEDFYKAQAVPTSNTQLYKQAGNSIVVNVLEAIFKNLFGVRTKSWYR